MVPLWAVPLFRELGQASIPYPPPEGILFLIPSFVSSIPPLSATPEAAEPEEAGRRAERGPRHAIVPCSGNLMTPCPFAHCARPDLLNLALIGARSSHPLQSLMYLATYGALAFSQSQLHAGPVVRVAAPGTPSSRINCSSPASLSALVSSVADITIAALPPLPASLLLADAAALLLAGAALSWLRVELGFHTAAQVTVGAVAGAATALAWGGLWAAGGVAAWVAADAVAARGLAATTVAATGLFSARLATDAVHALRELLHRRRRCWKSA